MRRFVPPFVTLMVVFTAAAGSARSAAQTKDAASVLAAARTAIGGDNKLAAVKTFIANGRTRQVRGENLVPIEFEIQAELPDKYSRRDEFPAQDQGPSTAGFVGDELVLIPRPLPPPPRPGAAPPPPGQQEAALRARMMAAKQDFARLMLGMFASSFSGFPLTFTYAGEAEAPQGKADVIDVKGPANFAGRLFIHAETHLPILFTWQAPGGPARPGAGAGGPPQGPPPGGAPAATPAPAPQPAGGAPGATGAPGAAAQRPGGPPAMVEQRLYFAEYRDVDGLKLPFRLRRGVGADTTEETTFDRFRINARIDPRRFDTTAK
jgi:hypothetical protein